MLNELNTLISAKAMLAVIMAYIAYQQWQTNERKRRQDLFEMRYEHLYKNTSDAIGKISKIFELNRDKIEEFQNNYKADSEKLNKYSFLIKRKDFKKLENYLKEAVINTVSEYKMKLEDNEDVQNKNDDLQNKINLLLEPYLRIESEVDLFGLVKNFAIDFYEFFLKRILNFLGEKTSVILNWFQDLANRKSLSTKDKDGKIPNQVRNDEKGGKSEEVLSK